MKVRFDSILCAALVLLLQWSPAFAQKASANRDSRAPAGNLSFEDDFDQGDISKWKFYGGGFAVVDQELEAKPYPGHMAVAVGTAVQSFIYEADVTVGPTGNAGLIFKVTAPTVGTNGFHGYYAGLDAEAGRVQVGKMNGEWQELAYQPFPVKANQTYHLKIEQRASFIDVYVDGQQIVGVVDRTHQGEGAIGLRTFNSEARFDNVKLTDLGLMTDPVYDWSWVKGAVFVPSNAVNEAQQWEEFDPAINDRELAYAAAYGINVVRVFLHFSVWQKDPEVFLSHIETFLQLADKHGIKSEFVFFDDVWDPTPVLAPYPDPIPGVHNSRWIQSPGDFIKDNYAAFQDQLETYVKDVVVSHLHDHRIIFWETFNEPGNSQSPKHSRITQRLMNEARIWIKETGSSIPVTATAGKPWLGEPFSDFYSWHFYEDYSGAEGGKSTICTECMNRATQTLPGVIDYMRGKTGYVLWELMIGRDNCRFPWGSPQGAPEPIMPFHGVIYPDGHPWSVADAVAIRGEDFSHAPFFEVDYYRGEFEQLAKSSITPFIDFDLGNELGTGSPDASAGIPIDHFSMRWRGQITPQATGSYTFYLDADSRASLWIDGKDVAVKSSLSREETETVIELKAGQTYGLVIEYLHKTGPASFHVNWSGPGLPKQVLKSEGRAAPLRLPQTSSR